MEVWKIFLTYIYTSSSYPYFPSYSIFSHDDYQLDVGNLPHMHRMISLKYLEMNEEQLDKIHELIRSYFVDIVRVDEVQSLVDEEILGNDDDIYVVQEFSEEILSHKCTPRCLRRIDDGDGTENFEFRKPKTLNIIPDNTRNCHNHR